MNGRWVLHVKWHGARGQELEIDPSYLEQKAADGRPATGPGGAVPPENVYFPFVLCLGVGKPYLSSRCKRPTSGTKLRKEPEGEKRGAPIGPSLVRLLRWRNLQRPTETRQAQAPIPLSLQYLESGAGWVIRRLSKSLYERPKFKYITRDLEVAGPHCHHIRGVTVCCQRNSQVSLHSGCLRTTIDVDFLVETVPSACLPHQLPRIRSHPRPRIPMSSTSGVASSQS